MVFKFFKNNYVKLETFSTVQKHFKLPNQFEFCSLLNEF